ncbi:solute carrier family 26 member 6 [Biomphalaria glabrata]|nr:solute carrier family 26 member 6-like [Biomphalaria glabrata]
MAAHNSEADSEIALNVRPTEDVHLPALLESVNKQASNRHIPRIPSNEAVGMFTQDEHLGTDSNNKVNNLNKVSSNEPSNRGLGLDEGSHRIYLNHAFEHTDETVLEPGHLWHQSDEDEHGDHESYSDDKVIIDRPIYSQDGFEQGFGAGSLSSRTIKDWIKSKVRCDYSWQCVRKIISHHLPFLAIMKEYNVRKDLLADVIAGLTVAIMHIPQGMAYGQLASLQAVYGLYVSFFPVILYFFFGTSKHISIGTFAIISLMMSSAVTKGLQNQNLSLKSWNQTVDLGGGNVTFKIVDNKEDIDRTKLMLAMSVSFVVGVIQFVLGLCHLGFLTVYLSDPLISGFTTGAAFHVFTSQIKHIFGISAGTYSGVLNLFYTYRDIFKNIPQTKAVTLIASIVCIIILVIVKEYINTHPKIKPKMLMPVPIELIVVVLGTIISHFAELEVKYSVKSVGDIPVGLPAPNLNAFSYIPNVITDAIALAIVAFAINVSMAKMFAKKHNYSIDANQELLAYGTCNIISSFFSSFASAASLSRSVVQENVGGKTQVTSLVSSAMLLIVLLVVGPYFKSLPNCVLASIILVSLKGIFKQVFDLKTLWIISLSDFLTWVVTFLATVLLDVDLGLLVGVVFALLTVIAKSQRPYSCLMGQVPGTDIYRDISVYSVAKEVPHIKIFRFDSAIFFANAEYFKTSLYKMTVNPYDLKKIEKKLTKRQKKVDREMERSHPRPSSLQETNMDRREGSGIAVVSNQWDAVNSSTSAQSENTTVTDSKLPVLTDIHYIIIDCSTMGHVDSMGVKAIQQVITELNVFNITVYLSHCKAHVREMFGKTNFYKTEGKNYLFITTHDAVVNILQRLEESSRHSTREVNTEFNEIRLTSPAMEATHS